MIDSMKMILQKIENSPYAPLLQLIKFGLVGVSNTLISYSIEMLCYYVLFANVALSDTLRIAVTSVLAFFISVTNSFYWNSKYVFAGQDKRNHLETLLTYLKTVCCYGVTGLLLAPILKVWLSGMGIPYWLASFGTLIITIPLNFILNKLWAYKSR